MSAPVAVVAGLARTNAVLDGRCDALDGMHAGLGGHLRPEALYFVEHWIHSLCVMTFKDGMFSGASALP